VPLECLFLPWVLQPVVVALLVAGVVSPVVVVALLAQVLEVLVVQLWCVYSRPVSKSLLIQL